MSRTNLLAIKSAPDQLLGEGIEMAGRTLCFLTSVSVGATKDEGLDVRCNVEPLLQPHGVTKTPHWGEDSLRFSFTPPGVDVNAQGTPPGFDLRLRGQSQLFRYGVTGVGVFAGGPLPIVADSACSPVCLRGKFHTLVSLIFSVIMSGNSRWNLAH